LLDRDSDALAVLAAVDLAALGERLDEQAHWTQLLSLGEQQRLALARAFLLKPDWLFLDEATSALEEDQEAKLYRRLAAALANTTVISIGHRRSLEAYHERVIAVDCKPGYPGLLRVEPMVGGNGRGDVGYATKASPRESIPHASLLSQLGRSES
jgi:putative ATP-binding cassette transporter